jgi:hypothetical protein
MTIEKARMISASGRFRNPRMLRDAALVFIERGEWDRAERLAERATIAERKQLDSAA